MIGEVNALSSPQVLPQNSETKGLRPREVRSFQDPDSALKQHLFSPTHAELYLLLNIFHHSGTYDCRED